MDTLCIKGETLTFRGVEYRCSIGKGGFSDNKREGDGATPTGTFYLRECWYRPDRVDAPKTGLPVHIIHQNDGWCDDSESAEYNTHVKLPYSYSYENLWREDGAYDLIVPLGYNDDPIITGRGSAIFMHCERKNYIATEGCVALAKLDLIALLPLLSTQTCIEMIR